MAAYGNKNYETMYSGSYGPLEPEYGNLFTGYRVSSTGRISAPTSPQTANQLTEVSSRLSEGVKAVELQPISPQVFETIPKQHFKEIERLGKLTGADFSLHAPLIDPAGFTQEGKWSKLNRIESETRIKNVIDRAHQLSPKGNIPIVLHASVGIPSSEWKPVKGKPEMQSLLIANRETGALANVEREQRFFPEEKIITPKKAMDMHNSTEWDNHLMPLMEYKKEADRLLNEAWPIVAPKWNERAQEMQKIKIEFDKGNINAVQANKKFEEINRKNEPELQPFFNKVQMAQQYHEEIGKHLATLYDKAYKYAPEGEKEKRRKEIEKIAKEFNKIMTSNPSQASAGFHPLIENLRQMTPESYVTSEQFALEHGKKTIANAAFHGYKKFGDSAPLIAIENFFPGTVFSKGKELGQFVKASRKEFVEVAKKSGYSEGEAEKTAEKLIGATWDVGHINLMRKKGFTKQDVVEETKKIAPFVKHVHITDNFGYEDSHLPPGMGDVPIKKMLRELEKAGFKGKEVMEAGGFVAQFKTSPTPYILEAMGSPLYATQTQEQPFWNQVRGVYGAPGGYNMGYGMMLPEQHFATYGGGFSSLPMELGGKAAGKGQQFAGAPME